MTESADEAAKSAILQGNQDDVKRLSSVVFISFVWIVLGICIIYGIRMWFNSNINPAFMPIAGAAFAGAFSFVLVLFLQQIVGIIRIEGAGARFEGASAPIVMWCICFTVICFGLYLLGFVEAFQIVKEIDRRSVLELLLDQEAR